MRLLRIAVMGGGGVGKSAITIRFINGAYVEVYDPTTVEDSYRKQFEVDREPCLLEILDTAGIDQYLSLNDLFIHDNDGFVLVFSVTQSESLQEVITTRENIRRIKDEDHVPMVLVGNKSDLVYEREVDNATAMRLAKDWRCEYIETSARDNINIVPVFEAVVRQLRRTGIHGQRIKERKRMKNKCVIL